MTIQKSNISRRTKNALYRNGYKPHDAIEDLPQRREAYHVIRGIGSTGFRDIQREIKREES